MSEAKSMTPEDWARLRFSVVGPLLAAPPAPNELATELARLAGKVWRHPVTREPVRFAQSTIERWYYAARRERRDPVGVLRRRVRKDAGQRGGSLALAHAIRAQHRAHPAWINGCTPTICPCWSSSTRSWDCCPPTPRSAGG